MKTLLISLAAAALLTGCKGNMSGAADAPDEGTPATIVGANDNAAVTPVGDGLPVDHPPIDIPPEIHSRGARRLSVGQLRASLPIAMGKTSAGADVTWTSGGGTAYFTTFSRALGEADYLNITEENLEPSPLYMKFMDDAARDVCDKALVADFAKTDAAARTLLRHVALTDNLTTNEAGIERNLRYLKLRLHAVKIADGDSASLEGLKKLFGAAAKANNHSVREGWRAVCIALLTAPEFHLY